MRHRATIAELTQDIIPFVDHSTAEIREAAQATLHFLTHFTSQTEAEIESFMHTLNQRIQAFILLEAYDFADDIYAVYSHLAYHHPVRNAIDSQNQPLDPISFSPIHSDELFIDLNGRHWDVLLLKKWFKTSKKTTDPITNEYFSEFELTHIQRNFYSLIQQWITVLHREEAPEYRNVRSRLMTILHESDGLEILVTILSITQDEGTIHCVGTLINELTWQDRINAKTMQQFLSRYLLSYCDNVDLVERYSIPGPKIPLMRIMKALSNLTYLDSTYQEIIDKQDGISVLIHLLMNTDKDSELLVAIIEALAELCRNYAPNQDRICQRGGIPILTNLLDQLLVEYHHEHSDPNYTPIVAILEALETITYLNKNNQELVHKLSSEMVMLLFAHDLPEDILLAANALLKNLAHYHPKQQDELCQIGDRLIEYLSFSQYHPGLFNSTHRKNERIMAVQMLMQDNRALNVLSC